MMGDGAIYQFASDTGMSFSDAEECLYGELPQKWRCPICNRKSRTVNGVLMHLNSGFHKPSERLADAIGVYKDAMAALTNPPGDANV